MARKGTLGVDIFALVMGAVLGVTGTMVAFSCDWRDASPKLQPSSLPNPFIEDDHNSFRGVIHGADEP